MTSRFDGKTVMVTGAGTGFGAEIAKRAAIEGAERVVVHYRSSSAGAEATAKAVEELGSKAQLVQGDITSWDEIKRMADEAGDVDALVNNVGDMASGQNSWREVTEESIDHVLAVDIKGTMLMVHEFGKAMRERASSRCRCSRNWCRSRACTALSTKAFQQNCRASRHKSVWSATESIYHRWVRLTVNKRASAQRSHQH